MNTDKLVPIDFSRNITRAVTGDVVWNNYMKIEFSLTEDSAAKANSGGADGVFFVVSFADRPNTGNQPVGDDVVVSVKWDDGEYQPYRLATSFSWIFTRHGPNAESWKPNHAAMLKQWQASQLTEEAKRMDNIARNGNDGDHYDKPTFTQAQCDAGEFPAVGSRVMYLAGTGIKKENGTFTKGYWDETTIIAHHNDMTWLDTHGIQSDITIKPIQTAEQKAIDNMCYAMEMQNGSPKSVYKRYSAPVIEAIKAGKVHGIKWVGE